jgi:hypothetical protein
VKSGVATALIALLVLAFFEQARPAISLQDMQAALQRWTQQLSADAKP